MDKMRLSALVLSLLGAIGSGFEGYSRLIERLAKIETTLESHDKTLQDINQYLREHRK